MKEKKRPCVVCSTGPSFYKTHKLKKRITMKDYIKIAALGFLLLFSSLSLAQQDDLEAAAEIPPEAGQTSDAFAGPRAHGNATVVNAPCYKTGH